MKHGTAHISSSIRSERQMGMEDGSSVAPETVSSGASRSGLAGSTAAEGDGQSLVDLLKTLLGKPVTIVNPESYEEAPVGHQIRAGFYRAKPIGLGRDFLVIATEFVHASKGQGSREPVRQYIPFAMIKRISVMKSERVIHL